MIEFLFGVQRRLANILRWNTTPRINTESVASHSYFVVLYSIIISDYIKANYNLSPDIEKVCKIAVLHDLEESFSGDIVASIKASSVEFRNVLEDINLKVLDKIFDHFDNKDEYISYWKMSRDYSYLESKIVRVADLISQILYSFEEIKMGNSFMNDICENSVKHLRSFEDQWVQDMSANIELFLQKHISFKNLNSKLFSHEFIAGEKY